MDASKTEIAKNINQIYSMDTTGTVHIWMLYFNILTGQRMCTPSQADDLPFQPMASIRV